MNRHALYLAQRMASAAASAMVYIAADMLTKHTHRTYKPKRYTSSQHYKSHPKKRPSYTDDAADKPHKQMAEPPMKATRTYRSMHEQAKQQRQKG